MFALHATLPSIADGPYAEAGEPPTRLLGDSFGLFCEPVDVKFLSLNTADDALAVLDGLPPGGRLQVLTVEGVLLQHLILNAPGTRRSLKLCPSAPNADAQQRAHATVTILHPRPGPYGGYTRPYFQRVKVPKTEGW